MKKKITILVVALAALVTITVMWMQNEQSKRRPLASGWTPTPARVVSDRHAENPVSTDVPIDGVVVHAPGTSGAAGDLTLSGRFTYGPPDGVLFVRLEPVDRLGTVVASGSVLPVGPQRNGMFTIHGLEAGRYVLRVGPNPKFVPAFTKEIQLTDHLVLPQTHFATEDFDEAMWGARAARSARWVR